MEVEILYESSTEELIDRIKNVPLLSDNSIKPYKNSKVEITEFDIDEIRPTSFYLLEENLNEQKRLREELLKEYAIDTLKLEKWYIIKTDGCERSLIPPVTQNFPFNGEGILLEDGNHRAWIAKELNEIIKTAHIERVPREIPYYAYPNPNGWEDTTIFKNISEVKIKKTYRTKDKREQYKLYRNYDAVFPGIGKPR